MELTIAYHKLMTYNKKYTYIMKDGQIVFNNVGLGLLYSKPLIKEILLLLSILMVVIRWFKCKIFLKFQNFYNSL